MTRHINYDPRAAELIVHRARAAQTHEMRELASRKSTVPAFVWLVLVVANVAGWATWALVF